MSVSHPPTETHRRSCYVSGRVQGVGFRCAVQNIAMQYAVQGFVRNLPDGRVEIVMEGSDREMDQILDSLHEKMEGFIREVKIDQQPATGEFQRFSIRH